MSMHTLLGGDKTSTFLEAGKIKLRGWGLSVLLCNRRLPFIFHALALRHYKKCHSDYREVSYKLTNNYFYLPFVCYSLY